MRRPHELWCAPPLPSARPRDCKARPAGFQLAVLPSFALSASLALTAANLIRAKPGGGASGSKTPPSPPRGALKSLEEDGESQMLPSSPPSLRRLLHKPAVACTCLAIMAHAGAQGFTDTTLGQHIQLSKGVDASVAGAAFTVAPAVYAISCLYVGRCTHLSLRTQVCPICPTRSQHQSRLTAPTFCILGVRAPNPVLTPDSHNPAGQRCFAGSCSALWAASSSPLLTSWA